MPLQGVFGFMTRVTRVSSDNANIVAEHQGPAEVLSQFGDTSTPQFTESESVTIVAASGVLVAASGDHFTKKRASFQSELAFTFATCDWLLW